MGIKTITIHRSDFKDSQDHPHESLFESVLAVLGVKTELHPEVSEVDIEYLDYTVVTY